MNAMKCLKKSGNQSVIKIGDMIEGLRSSIANLLKGGLIMITFLLALSCQHNTDRQISRLENDSALSTDSIKPDVNIKVNRHYDDDGNLIGYDSVYSSFYSSMQGDTARMDSVMHGFDTFFRRHHSFGFDRQFNSLFFEDSLRHFDFFQDDFFRKRYELNDSYLQDMMQRMDSVKNHFFRERILSDPTKKPRSPES
jgi:hypothetical protein